MGTSLLSVLSVFAAAMLVGLSIAAPVGPIGLLTIQRSLQQGSAAGLATGLGAATADALYGAVGAFGVAWLVQGLTAARVPLALAGGGFLLWLAWRLWRSPVHEHAAADSGGVDLWRHFVSTFALTLSNPATILSFIAVFGALAGRAAGASPWLLIAGVFCGSALWWLALSQGVSRLRHRFDTHWRRRINRASALLLAVFALWQGSGALL
jgi:threonine/homoserine/homoserine lactone efflux protein